MVFIINTNSVKYREIFWQKKKIVFCDLETPEFKTCDNSFLCEFWE